jgi:hypothetical protein
MADMLIRDVPDDVVAVLEARARRLGLSRSDSAQARPGRGCGRLPRQRWGSGALRRELRRSGRPGRDVTGLGATDWLVDKPAALVRFGTPRMTPRGAGLLAVAAAGRFQGV